MAEHGNYKLTDITIEDKFKYREIVYAKPGEEKKGDAKM